MERTLSTVRTCPDLFEIPGSGAIPRVHKYLPSILNSHISWLAKKAERPLEIQRLNPSLGSRQYSERSIKACLPDVQPRCPHIHRPIELSLLAVLHTKLFCVALMSFPLVSLFSCLRFLQKILGLVESNRKGKTNAKEAKQGSVRATQEVSVIDN